MEREHGTARKEAVPVKENCIILLSLYIGPFCLRSYPWQSFPKRHTRAWKTHSNQPLQAVEGGGALPNHISIVVAQLPSFR